MAGNKSKILKATKQIGTYRPAFDSSINILASLLDRRDVALKKFKESGEEQVIELPNRSLATHPYLKQAMECESLALSYLKEMGLTASGFKKIKGEKEEVSNECQLEDLRKVFKVG
ncbi:MAG: P27 family phage terminase small subunit [Mogibacterium sp.]|nr:P27 family phage terminase small subunit [Mogibacterium sp.]